MQQQHKPPLSLALGQSKSHGKWKLTVKRSQVGLRGLWQDTRSSTEGGLVHTRTTAAELMEMTLFQQAMDALRNSRRGP
jgi:hypothetical protein